jgi:hypothetical protein
MLGFHFTNRVLIFSFLYYRRRRKESKQSFTTEMLLRAFTNSLIASAGTCLGGLGVFWFLPGDAAILSANTAAGGVMLGLSLLDLLPSAINGIGVSLSSLWFVVGMIMFVIAQHFLLKDIDETLNREERLWARAVLTGGAMTVMSVDLLYL